MGSADLLTVSHSLVRTLEDSISVVAFENLVDGIGLEEPIDVGLPAA